MICLSPDVTKAVSKPSIDKSLHFRLEFLMDGAKNVLDTNLSDFIYEVNPEVISFPGADRTCVFNMDENYLEITVSITLKPDFYYVFEAIILYVLLANEMVADYV